MNERFGRLDARLGVDQTALDDGRRYSSAIPEGAAGRDRAGRYPTHARHRRGDAGATSAFESGRHVSSAWQSHGLHHNNDGGRLSVDHVPASLRAPFGLARKDSRDDAFGGIAGTVSGNSFDF